MTRIPTADGARVDATAAGWEVTVDGMVIGTIDRDPAGPAFVAHDVDVTSPIHGKGITPVAAGRDLAARLAATPADPDGLWVAATPAGRVVAGTFTSRDAAERYAHPHTTTTPAPATTVTT